MAETGNPRGGGFHTTSHHPNLHLEGFDANTEYVPKFIMAKFQRQKTAAAKMGHKARPETFLRRYFASSSVSGGEAKSRGSANEWDAEGSTLSTSTGHSPSPRTTGRLRAPRASVGFFSPSDFPSVRRSSVVPAAFASVSSFTPKQSEDKDEDGDDEQAQYLRLHYDDDNGQDADLPVGSRKQHKRDEEGERKKVVADKIERVRRAGFAGPRSVSRRAQQATTVEYKPELLADRARLLRTLTRREVGLGGGQEGVYSSMGKVSRMVAVSKQLTEDIGTMDTALRMRLTAMFRDGDHRAVERCFEPTRGPKRKLKGKTDQKPVVRVGGGGGSGKARVGGAAAQAEAQARRVEAGGVFGQAARKQHETKGSGFRKRRSQLHAPRWIDHTRLLQRAQLIADLEWNAYLVQRGREDRKGGASDARGGGGGT